ncbi:MAG: hypothetical protein PHV24_08035 [Candidatus Kapabacteria bacterium]|nr:hypothetical protein [Candidatus Kapabacteria bacterium]
MSIDYEEITRNEFMEFFRDDEKLATLSADDRLEIFASILPGDSDVTVENLQGIADSYGVPLTVLDSDEIVTRNRFMEFFRDDEKFATLSVDDRLEIFASILPGDSDVTVENLQGIADNYGVPLVVMRTDEITKDSLRDILEKAGISHLKIIDTNAEKSE